MIASASDLHPLGKPLTDAELRFVLQGAACGNEQVLVEAIYKPYREWDVRRRGALHLFDSIWRIGSRDRISVQEDRAHRTQLEVTAKQSNVEFAVPLLAKEEPYRRYQLESVRVNRIVFDRWFAQEPTLDAGFGLVVTSDALRGNVRLGALAADPLTGSLPLWPGMRTVELAVSSVQAPAVQLWDSHAKHHWDGWRQASPQEWPGGWSTLARHISGPTVWYLHQYYVRPGANASSVALPTPPQGVIPGVGLDIFWPEGSTLDFPETFFEGDATGFAVQVSRLTPRIREILQQSATRRPGVELHSYSSAEWKEVEAFANAGTVPWPVEFSVRNADGGKKMLVVKRGELSEPWLYFFGSEYDSGQRFAVNVVRFDPTPWQGPLPE
jgi:hypothetical protein